MALFGIPLAPFLEYLYIQKPFYLSNSMVFDLIIDTILLRQDSVPVSVCRTWYKN